MKKATRHEGPARESLRALPEVDFARLRRGPRGKYAHLLTGDRVRAAAIDPDIWDHFGSADAINAALRMLVAVATKTAGKPARTKDARPHRAA